jgi:hypothetical protein
LETKPSTTDVLRLHRDSLRTDRASTALPEAKRHEVTAPTVLGSSLDTLEYVVTTGLGTPVVVTQTIRARRHRQRRHVGAVSPVSRHRRYAQKDELFDPARSVTSSAIGCGSAACNGLRRDLYGNGCSKRRQCRYIVNCGDGSITTGIYSADKLALTSAYTVVHFQFGCSHTVELFSNKADGLMGLGGGSSSLVSQTTTTKAFSYFLSLTTNYYSGFLTLGVLCASSSRFVVTLILPCAPTGQHRGRAAPPRAPSAFGAMICKESDAR